MSEPPTGSLSQPRRREQPRAERHGSHQKVADLFPNRHAQRTARQGRLGTAEVCCRGTVAFNSPNEPTPAAAKLSKHVRCTEVAREAELAKKAETTNAGRRKQSHRLVELDRCEGLVAR